MFTRFKNWILQKPVINISDEYYQYSTDKLSVRKTCEDKPRNNYEPPGEFFTLLYDGKPFIIKFPEIVEWDNKLCRHTINPQYKGSSQIKDFNAITKNIADYISYKYGSNAHEMNGIMGVPYHFDYNMVISTHFYYGGNLFEKSQLFIHLLNMDQIRLCNILFIQHTYTPKYIILIVPIIENNENLDKINKELDNNLSKVSSTIQCILSSNF